MTIYGPRATPRYLLRDGVGEDDVAAFAAEHGWDLVSRDVADRERGTEHDTMWSTRDRVTFHYHEDGAARRPYVYLAGRDLAKVEHFRDVVDGRLNPLQDAELLSDVSAQPPGPKRALAILLAGIGAPMGYDKRFFTVIAAAMKDDVAELRKVGVLASTYSPWPEYRPLLADLARDDADPEVRELAQATIRAFDEQGIPDS
jgi:hypothetical protein